MTRGTRILLAIVLGGAFLVAATVGAGAAAVYHSGSIAVEVAETDGPDLRIRVPTALVGAALTLAPASALDEVSSEIEPFLPALAAGWEELSELPDFTMVEVRSGDEHVRVEKSGDRLLVSVDAPDARVRVAVPLRTVGDLLERLG